tara:strand:- start:128 stop:457 length:330 start_codon:yes stop_codon:yes gene_type:complete
MSMDFVYDLTEKLEEQEIDYFLVTIRSGQKKDTADVFFRFKDDQSIRSLVRTLDNFTESAEKEFNKTRESTRKRNAKSNKKAKKPPKKKPPKKKPPKKNRRKKDDGKKE